MILMLCRNRVADFAKWKTVFDSHLPGQHEAGLRLKDMWQDLEDPNNVWFIFEVENLDMARAFISDPAAAETGKVSGVLDGECHFLQNT